MVSADFGKVFNMAASFCYAVAAYLEQLLASAAALDPELVAQARAAVIAAATRFGRAVRHIKNILANVRATKWGGAKSCFFEWVCHGVSLSFHCPADCSGVIVY